MLAGVLLDGLYPVAILTSLLVASHLMKSLKGVIPSFVHVEHVYPVLPTHHNEGDGADNVGRNKDVEKHETNDETNFNDLHEGAPQAYMSCLIFCS